MLARLFNGDRYSCFMICDEATGKRLRRTPLRDTVKESVVDLKNSTYVEYSSVFDHFSLEAYLKIEKSKNDREFVFSFNYDGLDIFVGSIFADNIRNALSFIADMLPENYHDYCYVKLSETGEEKAKSIAKERKSLSRLSYEQIYESIKECMLKNRRMFIEDRAYSFMRLGCAVEPSDFIEGLQCKYPDKWVRTFEDREHKGSYGFKAFNFDYCETRTGFCDHHAALSAGEAFNGHDIDLL